MNKHQHKTICDHHHHHEMTFNRSFAIAITANSLFIILQIAYAYIANSSSLLADAFHNCGDVLGLMFSWLAARLMQQKPTIKTTYGLKKGTIVAALLNGSLLVISCIIILSEAIIKLSHPSPIDVGPVIIVASIGILVNGCTARLFLQHNNDLNIRSAYLHLFYDALISVGVVISAAIMWFSNSLWIDPTVAICIALIIFYGTWSIFTDSFRLLIDAVPHSVSLTSVKDYFLNKPGVEGVHDLHIWALSTQEIALSVHLYMPQSQLSDKERIIWSEELHHQFEINHVTIQIEQSLSTCNSCE